MTLKISPPQSIGQFVNRRVEEDGHESPSAYVCGLIRKEQARVELRKLILEGLASPIEGPVNAAYWASKRAWLKMA